ncbi:MAG: IS5 family transposase [archaeon]
MKKEVKILKKLNGLLKQLSCPHYLHYFGPKKYKFVHHACALLLKETLKCSFRRISKLLYLLGIKVPTYSALCKSRKRIPLTVWQNMLTLTAGETSGKVAIDGTGFSRTNPSFHYIKRIDRKKPVKRFGKLSALFDLVTKKFLRLKIRSKPRHDIKDAKLLLRHQKGVRRFYGDRGYDAEHLHYYCLEKNIQTIIKPKKKTRKGWARKKQLKSYTDEEYHQRSLIESGFGSLKRKYGGSVLAKRAKDLKVEIYCKAISHNLELGS